MSEAHESGAWGGGANERMRRLWQSAYPARQIGFRFRFGRAKLVKTRRMVEMFNMVNMASKARWYLGYQHQK